MSNRMNRQERDKKRQSIIKYTLLILITFMTIGLIYKVGQNVSTIYNRNQVETVAARYGCLEDKLRGEGLVLRSETTVPATADGYFENVVAEKDKVARNALVGYYIIKDNKTAMRAPAAGVFTREVDGLEAALSDIQLDTVGPEVFKYQPISARSDGEIKADQGVYKIVNNLVPSRLLVHFPLEGLNLKVSEQQSVELALNGKPMGSFKVLAYKKEFKELIMLLESHEFQEQLLSSRLVKVELCLNSSDGYLIPKKSLVKKGQEKGIYCTQGENILFKPVKVLDQKDDIAVVEGIEATDLIVKNPAILKHNL